ncbi:unnamed protein product [Polarella glacialis]|uniref:Uncharacterized protein n=2 Tax=Polarella glacialis TaxID=89957 RepID=A0A813JU00_POLGL|nr:unnamed protein product [Polarella glacialis]
MLCGIVAVELLSSSATGLLLLSSCMLPVRILVGLSLVDHRIVAIWNCCFLAFTCYKVAQPGDVIPGTIQALPEVVVGVEILHGVFSCAIVFGVEGWFMEHVMAVFKSRSDTSETEASMRLVSVLSDAQARLGPDLEIQGHSASLVHLLHGHSHSGIPLEGRSLESYVAEVDLPRLQGFIKQARAGAAPNTSAYGEDETPTGGASNWSAGPPASLPLRFQTTSGSQFAATLFNACIPSATGPTNFLLCLVTSACPGEQSSAEAVIEETTSEMTKFLSAQQLQVQGAVERAMEATSSSRSSSKEPPQEGVSRSSSKESQALEDAAAARSLSKESQALEDAAAAAARSLSKESQALDDAAAARSLSKESLVSAASAASSHSLRASSRSSSERLTVLKEPIPEMKSVNIMFNRSSPKLDIKEIRIEYHSGRNGSLNSWIGSGQSTPRCSRSGCTAILPKPTTDELLIHLCIRWQSTHQDRPAAKWSW